MALDGNKVAALVMGGLFVGVWLWLLLFEPGVGDVEWFLWGMLGFAFAAATFVGRMGNDVARAATWVALGVGLAFLLSAAVFQQRADMMATVLTFAGGALIVAGLPDPGWQESAGPMGPAQ